MTMFARALVLLAMVTATGCGEPVWQGSLTEIIPRSWTAGELPTIQIVGDDLHIKVAIDMINPRGVRFRADFSGTLGGQPLQGVRWVNNQELAAVVPDLGPGDHDLEIVRADGLSAVLVAAATVLPVVPIDPWLPLGPPWDFDPPAFVGGDINQVGVIDDDLTFGPGLTTAYFVSDRSGNQEIWSAPFDATTLTLGTAALVTEVNSPDQDYDSEVSSDGLSIIFASYRPGTGLLWLAERPSLTDPFGTPSSLGFTGDDPTLSRDGLELIWDCLNVPCRATRASRAVAFGTTSVITEVDTVEAEYDFFLTPNGLHLLFVSDPGLSPDLYTATRPDAASPFDVPIALDDLNTSFEEREPWLSADGSLLFFTSNRSGRDLIYVSRRR